MLYLIYFFKGCATWHILIGQWYIPLWYTSAIQLLLEIKVRD